MKRALKQVASVSTPWIHVTAPTMLKHSVAVLQSVNVVKVYTRSCGEDYSRDIATPRHYIWLFDVAVKHLRNILCMFFLEIVNSQTAADFPQLLLSNQQGSSLTMSGLFQRSLKTAI